MAKKLLIGYFALGIFGNPEKDRGFVFLLVVVVWFMSAVILPLPFPLGVCMGTSLGSVLTLVSSFFRVWYRSLQVLFYREVLCRDDLCQYHIFS